MTKEETEEIILKILKRLNFVEDTNTGSHNLRLTCMFSISTDELSAINSVPGFVMLLEHKLEEAQSEATSYIEMLKTLIRQE